MDPNIGNTDQWRPLYISAVIGGSTVENRGIRAGLGQLARVVGGVPWTPADDEAAVDLELHVAGNLLKPDHVGMRTGRWARSSRVFVVQYAVPAELEGRSGEEVLDHLGRLLPEAVAAAEEGLVKKRNRLPVRQARAIAGTVFAMFEG
ncbi:hypothetical protein [Asanoa siamensis]|uniref:Uncharacterized protein n=1 Tax=Asanoa siamensis TaxID=926357 RepID=A0ABQ4D390_9ACTN|nr:hypothetical protein [Asanoa siamensis]GIF78001.1 hypothetical protein Asi02nite_75190 [Asanoa siamensis]